MKLGTRIFLAFLVIFAICFYYPVDRIVKDLRLFFLESMEDPLVDQANILAAFVAEEMEAGRFDPEKLRGILGRIASLPLSARIYDFTKTTVDVDLYVTDGEGRVLFDSRDRGNEGADYTGWRDVSLTLEGRYGARTTRLDPGDPASSVLYVAAPVVVHGKTAGVLTVAKPTANLNAFLEGARPRVLRVWFLSALLAVLLAFFVSWWITRPVQWLTRYANDVRDGKRVDLPRLGGGELGEMGRAIEKMKEALEGRKYVEEYIQTLTHEIKSPLSAIRGAAELLGEEMPRERRARFLANIRGEAGRIQDIVDRMLELSDLETRKAPRNLETLSPAALAASVLEGGEWQVSPKNIHAGLNVLRDVPVTGDRFLLRQALSNLLQNAVDFSPEGGRIEITVKLEGTTVLLSVEDEGPGIPEYAMGKVFDKFFSLRRPDTGKKSTGLGLNFVKEVASLHGGRVRLENRERGGLRAVMILPAGSKPSAPVQPVPP
ncbi:MAG TPA: two-component system sensor histidine kinase CreC [Syntrophales bacterium]|nr:two-component system sensor histidine kinase CreC [Syntrophales bacterium]HQB30403.1 two-component system sensor histidine kinase CreC [Syntrophales bacterium]